MQTKDQGKGPKDWKVVAAVATASALGLSGLALADSNDDASTPDPIDLQDRTPVTEVTVAKSTSNTLADLGIKVATLDSANSPFDEPAPTTVANSAASATSAGSPEPAPAPAPSADSPDPAPAPPADDSASAASGSGASAGSVGSSADS